ncbi:MAG: TonB-dependent receptor [Xanthomonadales bacterium]|nr:TonB-dependent receptor [Xanthomonadales bacterium]
MDEQADTPAINPSEYLSTIPGVSASDRQNYAQDEQISIRGFGARSTFGVRGVRLYTDGIPATMPDGQGQVSHFNLDSAERIEVLRGPFSALYGNSSGGVIQVFTADGTEPPTARFNLVGGSYGTGRASVNSRGRHGGLGWNLDFSHFQTDGYRRHSAAERDSGNAKLTWEAADGGTLTLLANTLSSPAAEDPLGLTREQMAEDPRQVAAVAEQYDTRKSVYQRQVGAVFEQPVGAGHRLRALAYAGQRSVVQFLAIPPAAQARPTHAGGVIDLDSDYYGADLRWIWQGELAGRPLEFAAGLAVDQQAQHRRGYENFVGDTLGVRGRLRRDEDDTVGNLDQYAQATWHLAEAWSLTLGARHSEVRFRSADHYVTAGNPDDSGRTRYAATTPVAGLMWRAAEWAHAYASVGKGFETPTFNELGYRSDGGGGLAFDLLPARSRNGELGLKLRPHSTLRANLAVFRADTRDELAVATSSGGRTTYRNIGRSRRQGVEAELDWRPREDWRLQLAYTRLDASFRSSFLACAASPCTVPDTPVAAGTRMPGIPETDLHLALRHGGEFGWNGVLEASYIGSVSVDDRATERAPAYFVVAAGIGHGHQTARGVLRTFARVDNLFDRAYAGSVIVNDSNGRFFEPAPGRTFTLGMRWEWGSR